MIAGVNIRFLPGVIAGSGGYMRGYIAPAGPYCITPPLVKSVIIEDSGVPEVSVHACFRIYPNPTNGNFTVELFEKPEVTPALIEVYDMMGSKLLEAEIQSGRTHLFSLGDQVPGIYLVKVLQNNHAGVGKIVRQQGN